MTWSQAAVSGPLAQPDLADVQAGVAVHREHGVDAVEGTGDDGVVGPAGHDLLGRLEDAAHRDAALDEGRLALLEGEQRADERGDVHVVPARVADAGGRRRAKSRPVRSRTGSASMSARRRPGATASGAPMSASSRCREQADADARRRRGGGPRSGRPRLLAGQLGMGMEVPPDVDQLGCE